MIYTKNAGKFELVLNLIEISNFHFSGNIFSIKFMSMKQKGFINAIDHGISKLTQENIW